MAEEALDMLRRERSRLWKAKRLLQRFRGDSDWLPCSTFETDDDDLLLGDGNGHAYSGVPSLSGDSKMLDYNQLPQHGFANGTPTADTAGELDELPNGASRHDEDVMQGVRTQDMAEFVENQRQPNGEAQQQPNDRAVNAEQAAPTTNDDLEQAQNPAVTDLADRDAISETASQSNGTNTHGMTTRARARSPAERSDRTPSPTPSDSASARTVNPWFLAPPTSLTDRNLGLPLAEADDTRKLLLLYVQKQEQIVRSLDTLHSGLQKADRLRQYVYHTCKAEAHITDGKTDMSDGEDWYDVEQWSLQAWELKDGKLEKGKDEVEDEQEERNRRPGRGRRVNRI